MSYSYLTLTKSYQNRNVRSSCYCFNTGEVFPLLFLSFRLVRNHSLKKDAGQASMTDMSGLRG